MSKMNETQLKSLLKKACEAKDKGESLSSVFKDFSKTSGMAKGSVRNVYYQTMQKMNEDKNYMAKMLGDGKLEVAKIISFEDGEADLLLERILTGVTFGKSVRRVIFDMTENPKLALRYQNKYRNLLKYEEQRVIQVIEKLTERYGKCYNPYQERGGEDKNLTRLKKEINDLYDKIASGIKAENKALKQKILALEEKNKALECLLAEQKSSSLKDYFKDKSLVKGKTK